MKMRRENGVWTIQKADKEYKSDNLHTALLDATGCGKSQAAELIFQSLNTKKETAK